MLQNLKQQYYISDVKTSMNKVSLLLHDDNLHMLPRQRSKSVGDISSKGVSVIPHHASSLNLFPM